MSDAALQALVTFLPVYYLSSFLHEVGHAVMAARQGFLVTSFGMGVGGPLWVGSWRGTRVYLCWRRPFQGLTFFFPLQLFQAVRPMAWALAGGVLANLVLTLVFLGLWWLLPWGRGIWLTAAILNGIFTYSNLIPFNIQIGRINLRSDGAQILSLLRQGAVGQQYPERLRFLHALRRHWTEIGDTFMLRLYLLDSAAIWAELGDAARAEDYLAQAEAVPGEPPAVLRALEALTHAQVAERAGRREAAAQALAEAEQGFQALRHEVGLFLIALTHAGRAVDSGDATQAVAQLDQLAGHPLVAQSPLLRVQLLVARVQARLAVPQAPGLEALLAEYESTRRNNPSWMHDLRIYRAVGRCHAGNSEWSQAEVAYGKALAAAQRLYNGFTDPAERDSVRQGLADLLAEVRACWQQVGKIKEAEDVDALLLTATVQELAEVKQDRRRFWKLSLFNMLVGVTGGYATFQVFSNRTFGPIPRGLWVLWLMWLWLLVAFSGVALFSNLIRGIMGRFVPRVRGRRWRDELALLVLMWAALPVIALICFLVLVARAFRPG